MELQAMRAVFLDHLQGGTGARVVAGDVDDRLDRLWSAGHAAWPGIVVPLPVFVCHVAERVPPDADIEHALENLHAADLYLACACVQRTAGAVERFERQYAESIAAALRRIDGAASFIDEARQLLRHRLFVAEGDAPPRIATYSGRGPLASWVVVAAQRIGLNLARGQRPQDSNVDGAIAAALPAGIDPELDYLRTRYRNEFRVAFQTAIARLTQRERMVLRLHLVRGLPHEQIASSYNVNASTVSRWITKAKSTLLTEVQRDLRERLHVGTTEFHSLAALVGSKLDLSLARWLGEEHA